MSISRGRRTVLIQKADLQPTGNTNPVHVALNETVIRIDGQQYWLYTAVDPALNQFLHIRLFPSTTIALIQQALQELQEKHDC